MHYYTATVCGILKDPIKANGCANFASFEAVEKAVRLWANKAIGMENGIPIKIGETPYGYFVTTKVVGCDPSGVKEVLHGFNVTFDVEMTLTPTGVIRGASVIVKVEARTIKVLVDRVDIAIVDVDDVHNVSTRKCP